ncbi:MucR family transcriptional regulator [Methylobacterium hispanicum]
MSPAAVLASPEERASVVAAAYAKRDEPPAPVEAAAPAAGAKTDATLPASLAPETLEGAARRKRAVAVPPPLASLPDDAPAVPPALSVSPDAVIDLAGGKAHGNLGRFIADARGEDPEAYRRRFGLPKEYPMMAPRLIRTRGRVSEIDPVTFRRLSSGPVERDARFDGDPKSS